MNKKGFSLVELIAVITILGVLLSISTVAIFNIRDKQNEENELNLISTILTEAKRYYVDYKTVPSVKTLYDNGYVEFDKSENSNLYNAVITADSCINSLKRKFTIKINPGTSDEIIYNDCGCEEQVDGQDSEKICK